MSKIFRLLFLLVISSSFYACIGQTTGTRSFSYSFRHSLLNSNPSTAQLPDNSYDLRLSNSIYNEKCVLNNRNTLLNHCISWPNKHTSSTSPAVKPFFSSSTANTIDRRLSLAKRARSYLLANHSEKTKDCSSFVQTVLSAEGIIAGKLYKYRRPGEGNVAALYRLAKSGDMIHHRKVPAIGDLVFFNNTHDRNKDGKANDLLTHIGIVERVDYDGTVTFIHRVRRGILRYKMNLFSPEIRREKSSNKVLNHYLKFTNQGNKRSVKRLTGELFFAFATIVD
jgi:hypothetical protein